MHPLVFLSAGLTAGLVTSLSLRFVWALLAARGDKTPLNTSLWRDASAFNEIMYILSHCLLGAGLGGLYWLSWGLAGMVGVTWWQRGALFAAVLTALFGGGLLLLLRSLFKLPAVLMWCWLVEVALLSATVGLYCAWQWHRILV